MKRITFLAFVLEFVLILCAWPQRSILPDGVTKTTVQHRIDVSSCDIVHISGPVRELTVRDGEFDVYYFRRYADISKLTFTCDVETKR